MPHLPCLCPAQFYGSFLLAQSDTNKQEEPTSFLNQFQTAINKISSNWQEWTWAGVSLAAAILAALIIHFILFKVLARFFRKTSWNLDDILLKSLRSPTRVLLPLLAIQLTIPVFEKNLPTGILNFLQHVISIILIANFAWLLISLLKAGEKIILARHTLEQADNLQARRIHTQFRVIKRTIIFFILVIAVATILMTFPRVRQIGTSLLASAGVAGLVIGLAARPTVENLIAGLQIALTQPIRIDDVVVIDGEWGRIEEITATYVVVRIWDLRRLIVPFSKVLADSFQNWTRTSADILGTVMIYTDYTVPIDAVRHELHRLAEQHDKWDGKVCVLQVTEASEHTIGLRALVSAHDSGSAWELRCYIREKLIEYLQREYPHSLPKLRANVTNASPPKTDPHAQPSS